MTGSTRAGHALIQRHSSAYGQIAQLRGHWANLDAHELVEARTHAVIALVLRQRFPDGAEGDLPLGLRLRHLANDIEFAREFRAIRNKANGHVTHDRPSKSLTEFYDKYHQFIDMQYWNCLGFWGHDRDKEFPDLKEITDFSVLIQKIKPAGQ